MTHIQNQTRTAQSEVGKVEEKLREASKQAAQAKEENISLQQCLVTKLLNDSVNFFLKFDRFSPFMT